MNRETAILAVVICAAVTFGLRVLPFALFEGRKTPRAISYLGRVLPPAVIAMLAVYCLKDISFAAPGGFLPQLIASAVVALMQLWKKNTILSIAVGTAVYMALLQTVF